MKKHLLFIFTGIFLILLPDILVTRPNYNYKIKKIVIDAGHGGFDGGCAGKSSKEKDITLAISLKLGELIEKNLHDVEVIYTRREDHFVKLHERAAIANKNKADLFISIHCNAAKKGGGEGTETYVMGLDKSRENLAVARRENSVILMENDYEENYDGFGIDGPENEIIFSLYQNAFLEQSIQLAYLIEEKFKNHAGRKSRGVKQESFLVLYKTAMPSILVEAGFLTNKKEEVFLKNKEGQEIIAGSIYEAFKDYKQIMEGNHGSKAHYTDNSLSLYQEKKLPPIASIDEANEISAKENVSLSNEARTSFKIQLYDSYQAPYIKQADYDNACSDIQQEKGKDDVIFYMMSEAFNNEIAAGLMVKKLKSSGLKYVKVVEYLDGNRVD